MSGIFVTATGTDVGKTFVSALIAKKVKDFGFDVGYYKAAMSGFDDTNNDALYVKNFAALSEEAGELVSFVYKAALSPHLAAKLEGNAPNLDTICADYRKLSSKHQFMVVEGSGGIVCPIRYDEVVLMLEDIIKALRLSVVVVCSCALGGINSAVLTVEYLKSRQIPIKGLIFNRYKGGVMEDDNIKMIQNLTALRPIAIVKEGDTALKTDKEALKSLFE
ncbi:MAG: dethiobiotin synthase [Campylobacteraceae bacterium]|jgi:dethiobiotin synthetase|nr:dethiobiotin synthase [Campylobacteraceae bacterium]